MNEAIIVSITLLVFVVGAAGVYVLRTEYARRKAERPPKKRWIK